MAKAGNWWALEPRWLLLPLQPHNRASAVVTSELRAFSTKASMPGEPGPCSSTRRKQQVTAGGHSLPQGTAPAADLTHCLGRFAAHQETLVDWAGEQRWRGDPDRKDLEKQNRLKRPQPKHTHTNEHDGGCCHNSVGSSAWQDFPPEGLHTYEYRLVNTQEEVGACVQLQGYSLIGITGWVVHRTGVPWWMGAGSSERTAGKARSRGLPGQ